MPWRVVFYIMMLASSVAAPLNYDTMSCLGFMTLVAGNSLRDDDCLQTMNQLDERMRLMSAQMQWMNSTLVVFSAYSSSAGRGCTWDLPNLKVLEFNATQLLLEYNLNDVIPEIEAWSGEGPARKPLKHQYARISDIFRVLLAHKHQYTYLDYDVYYLNSDPNKYLRPHVGAAAWSSEKHYLEMSNSAFCLPRPVLEDMHQFIRERVGGGSKKYFYTELGPNMFHRVIYNHYPILMYTQNHPRMISVKDIKADVINYKHEMLHMTGLLRGNQKERLGLDLPTFLLKLRQELNLPPLSLVQEVDRSTEIGRKGYQGHEQREFFEPSVIFKLVAIGFVFYIWQRNTSQGCSTLYKLLYVALCIFILF